MSTQRQNEGNRITREYFWLSPGGNRLFTCQHLPDGKAVRRIGVVICNPVGYESVHMHRAIRNLADTLACQGFVVVRFDYAGTGNSWGKFDTPDLVDQWVADIEFQAESLISEFDIDGVCLVGVRFGAALAALTCATVQPAAFVAWQPCFRGARFVRELKAASLLARRPAAKDSPQMESGGFIFSNPTLDEIKRTDITSEHISNVPRAMVVSQSQKENDALADLFEETPADLVVHNEFGAAIRPPHLSDLPLQTIQSISCWLDAVINVVADRKRRQVEHNPIATFSAGGSRLRQSLVRTNESHLFGVLCENVDVPRSKRPLVVLSNAGSVHNIGPNNSYVDLSLRLAEAGIPTLRVDLENVGESVVISAENENHPYPQAARENLAEILTHCRENLGCERFILAGLCSGSHNSFHAALSLQGFNIAEIVFINPLTFYWRLQTSRDFLDPAIVERAAKHYQYALRDDTRWRRLLTGQVDYVRLVRFIFRYCQISVENVLARILELLRLKPQSQLAIDLRRLERSEIYITFIFSARDPGRMLLSRDAARTVASLSSGQKLSMYIIDEADHTFSVSEYRKDFIERLTTHLCHRYASSDQTDFQLSVKPLDPGVTADLSSRSQ